MTPLFQGAAVMVSRANGKEPQQLLAEVAMVSPNYFSVLLLLSETISLGKDPIGGGKLLTSSLALVRKDNGKYQDMWGQTWKVDLA